MSSREDTPEPGTSAATTNASQAGANRENAACPECRGASAACSSSCRHCFCRLCLWDWSLGEASCPRCRRPTRHPYPQHVALYHEVQERVYSAKRRRRRPSCSGRSGEGRPWQRRRRRRRSMRWPRDGRRRSRRGRGSDSPRRRRWWQQRRAREDERREGRAPGSWSQREPSRGHRRSRERSQGWDSSSRREQDTPTGSQHRSARQRSQNAEDRRSVGSRRGSPSRRSERRQREGPGSSRRRHRTRRRSRGRSPRRGRDTSTSSEGTEPHDHSGRQRRWSSWSTDQGRSSSSQWDSPGSRSRAGRRDT